jgi:hypothetical protein
MGDRSQSEAASTALAFRSETDFLRSRENGRDGRQGPGRRAKNSRRQVIIQKFWTNYPTEAELHRVDEIRIVKVLPTTFS